MIMGDDTIRNFGVVIAICGAIALFGGTTFAVWTFNVESKSDFGDGEFEYKFGVTEVEYDASFDGDSESDSFEYDSSDCDCNDLEDFFANLQMMFYALIACGIGLAYLGNSGEMDNVPTLAGVTALLSIAILAYTFMSLPEAWEEETEWFETFDEDPAFFKNAKADDEGGDRELNAMPSVGFFLPVVSLTLAGLLVKPELMD